MPSTPTQTTPSTNVFLNALQWGGWHWTDGGSAGTNITYYFHPGGRDLTGVFGAGSGTSLTWLSYEEAAYEAALQQWANVANITFTEVFSYSEADFVEFIYLNSSSTVLGAHETPESASGSDGTAWGAYNDAGTGWDSSGLQNGGYGFVTLVHEIGHGLGLAHPHDNGGGSGLFPGVSSSSDTGDNGLNQGIFTTMSYIDGWSGLGSSPSNNYGWQGGPSAFDIAAIQYLYGANTTYNSGSNNYLLGNVSGLPNQISTIWDTGGTDTITYNGSYGSTFNLNAATLLNAPGGGGFVSYVHGAPTSSLDHWNAFTIANGVVIENVTAGSGNDLVYLSSQNVANLIDGNGGTDTLYVSYSYGSGYSIQAGSTASNFVMIGASGTDTILDFEFVHFSNGTTVSTATLVASGTPNDVRNDFNGDGTSDILWYNASTTGVGMYEMNNGVPSWSSIGTGAANWEIVGTGDFTGDYHDDILWFNSATSSVGMFQMFDGAATWSSIGTAGSGWTINGTGDFNGDGTDDILWFNASSGSVGMYQMNNGSASWGWIGTAGSGWETVATGDFNGDSTDDILWFNASSGSIGMYQMNNGTPTWGWIGTAGSGWETVATGDFNGDSTDDILWFNASSGSVGMYQMNNGTPTWSWLGTAGSGWSVVATGDYNGDNTDDILWHNATSGAVGMYEMHNGAPSWQFIGTSGSGWEVLA
jgi:serralysin